MAPSPTLLLRISQQVRNLQPSPPMELTKLSLLAWLHSLPTLPLGHQVQSASSVNRHRSMTSQTENLVLSLSTLKDKYQRTQRQSMLTLRQLRQLTGLPFRV